MPDQTNICRKLIENGADVDVRGKDGKTPLHFAAEYGNLVQNFVDSSFSSWFLWNVYRIQGSYEIAESLFKHGANLDLADDNEETPIFTAIRNGNFINWIFISSHRE